MVARQATPCASAPASCATPRAAPATSRASRCSAPSRSSTTTTAPLDQLTLADVQQYAQPISYGITQLRAESVADHRLRAGQLPRQRRPDARPRAALRPADADGCDQQLRAARRLRLASAAAIARSAIRGGYGLVLHADSHQCGRRRSLTGGLDGYTTYTATPGQLGFPTLPDRLVPAAGVRSEDAAAVAAAGARHHDSRRRSRFLSRAVCEATGLNFDLLARTIRTSSSNPRSQVISIGAEREVVKGLFVGGDYVQPALDRSRPQRSISTRRRRSIARRSGRRGRVAAANATRPILPVNGGVRQVNVLTNLGVSDYNGAADRRSAIAATRRCIAALSYTLSKATNTTRAGRQRHRRRTRTSCAPRRRRARTERRRSAASRGDHVHLSAAAQPHGRHGDAAGARRVRSTPSPASTTTATARTTIGPVVDGTVIGKSAFRGTGTQDVSVFLEGRIKPAGRTILLRLEGFNLFNHGNILGRAQTTYGDTATVNTDVRPAGRRRHGDQRDSRRWRTSIRRGCSSCRCGFSLVRPTGGRGTPSSRRSPRSASTASFAR